MTHTSDFTAKVLASSVVVGKASGKTAFLWNTLERSTLNGFGLRSKMCSNKASLEGNSRKTCPIFTTSLMKDTLMTQKVTIFWQSIRFFSGILLHDSPIAATQTVRLSPRLSKMISFTQLACFHKSTSNLGKSSVSTIARSLRVRKSTKVRPVFAAQLFVRVGSWI